MQWAVEQAHTASNSPVVQVLVIVIAALVISIIGYVFKRNRSMYNDVHEIKDVLITPKPTPLNPNPPKGLIAVVADHTKTLAVLLEGTKEVNRRLDSLATGAKEIKGDTAALVHESTTNQGSSMRDAIDENRAAIGEVRTEQTRVRDEHDNEQKGL